jgi:hypothetical protein
MKGHVVRGNTILSFSFFLKNLMLDVFLFVSNEFNSWVMFSA